MPYVGRLAPSPTGLMHFGMARTFLVAWLDARAHAGRLLLRVEDLDGPRSRPEFVDAIFEDLEWLGLGWDGPVMFQSTRTERYTEALKTLGALGRTFECSCTRREVAMASSAPHGPEDEGPRYPGTCRQSRARRDRPASTRFMTRSEDVVEHTDVLFGRVEQNVDTELGDFIIKRTDGLFAYQLAVTVDDLDQGVTRIVRGQDLLSSMPRQILIRRLLDPSAPLLSSLHVPLVVDAEMRRLASRDGAAGIRARRANGESARSVMGHLAATLGLVPAGTQCSPEELVSAWDPTRLDTAPTVLGETP